MSIKYLFLILLWSFNSQAQGSSVKIHGHVKCSQSNEDMTLFRIRSYVATETLSKTISCDSSGYYEVFWNLDSITNRQLIIYAYQDTLAYNKAYPYIQQKCELRWLVEPRFYHGSLNSFFIIDDHPRRLDFKLEKIGSRSWSFLPVVFKKDTIEVEIDTLDNNTYTMRNSLCIVSSYLEDYPNKKIEIHGNAWEESRATASEFQ
jgi:hypothetical protein